MAFDKMHGSRERRLDGRMTYLGCHGFSTEWEASSDVLGAVVPSEVTPVRLLDQALSYQLVPISADVFASCTFRLAVCPVLRVFPGVTLERCHMPIDRSKHDDQELVPITPEVANQMFSFRGGRRYPAKLDSFAALLPVDEEENYRLKLQHVALIASLGRLHTTPIARFERVLDAGCGPGWWSMDFADAHPECEIIGIDTVPIQPEEIPPNLSFECDDIDQGLRFPDNHFDMVFSRKIFDSITNSRGYVKELIRVLKPGGYLNCLEADIERQMHPSAVGSAFALWTDGLINIYNCFERTPMAGSSLRPLMESVNLCDIEEYRFIVPGGNSPRATAQEQEVASLMTESTLISLDSLRAAYEIANDIHAEQLDLFFSEVRKDILSPKHVWWGSWSSVIGRKPLIPSPD